MHLLDSGTTGSMVFWGPPGCDSGVTDVRVVLEEAKGVLALTGRRTILFLDEIHRFNRAQQVLCLDYVSAATDLLE